MFAALLLKVAEYFVLRICFVVSFWFLDVLGLIFSVMMKPDDESDLYPFHSPWRQYEAFVWEEINPRFFHLFNWLVIGNCSCFANSVSFEWTDFDLNVFLWIFVGDGSDDFFPKWSKLNKLSDLSLRRIQARILIHLSKQYIFISSMVWNYMKVQILWKFECFWIICECTRWCLMINTSSEVLGGICIKIRGNLLGTCFITNQWDFYHLAIFHHLLLSISFYLI